jgi:NAD(P)-dependent dehydrogenase (short-subunit alcohol dehydrogenase family)
MKEEDPVDRVARVTGASYGIGLAISTELVRRGCTVMLSDVQARVHDACAALNAQGGRTGACILNVQEPASVEAGVETTVQKFGRLDILVTNAAHPRTARTILEMTTDDWDGPMAVNVRGALLCIQAAARRMIAQGEGGRIVTIGSTAGLKPYKRRAHYCSSKAAVIQLTKVAALELAEHGITVNCVCPGQTLTENLARMTDGAGLDPVEAAEMRKRQGAIPLGVNTPDDIASIVAHLASPGARKLTGQIIAVDGGGLLT